MDRPLMPKATAVWLVENTSLTFDQIAEFCGLHPLEVKGIADGEVATGVRGLDPVGAGMLTRDEIAARRGRTRRRELQLAKSVASDVKPLKRKEPRYTPLSKRQDRPDAIAWLLRNHPELSEQQICKLLGTTKATVQAVRDRTHWKSQEIRPRDPVLLGLCAQLELDDAVLRAQDRPGQATAPRQPPAAGPAHADRSPAYERRASASEPVLAGRRLAAAAPVALRQQPAVALDQPGDAAQVVGGGAAAACRG